jgi:hypothetical protein
MLVHRISAIFCGLFLVFAVFLPAAHADEWNQQTKLTFNQPVDLPHISLPAGTYWFVLASGPANRNVVQVYNHNFSRTYATLLTVPTYRAQATSRTELTFAERPSNQPEAILKWYYPGRFTGHEFIYSAHHEQQFARDAKQNELVPRGTAG